MAYHATAFGDLALYSVMEARAERAKRGMYRGEFRLEPGSPSLDLYTVMGWTHLAAEAAGAMHGKMCDALGDSVDSPLRRAARSVVALVLYMWGCRSNPLEWNYGHILKELARVRHGVRNHFEIWMQVRGTCLLAEGRECTLGATFLEGHMPDGDDPFAPDHELWGGVPGEELWEGALFSQKVMEAAGVERRVYWCLVSVGIVCVEHLCRLDAPVFMTWRETLKAWPALRWVGCAKEEWLRLRGELDAMGVMPQWGHRLGGRSAREVWEAGKTGDAMAEESLSDEPSALRGLLDDLEGVGAEASEAEFEEAMREAYGERLRDGVRRDDARCAYGASREERWGGARVRYICQGKDGCRGDVEQADLEGGQDRAHGGIELESVGMGRGEEAAIGGGGG